MASTCSDGHLLLGTTITNTEPAAATTTTTPPFPSDTTGKKRIPKSFLRIGTWNVHQFSNGNSEPTLDGICNLLQESNLDVIGLQEASGSWIPTLVDRLNTTTSSETNNHDSRPNKTTKYQLASKYGGTAIITRLQVVSDGIQNKFGKGRYSSCEVVLPHYCDGDDDNDSPVDQDDVLSIGVLHLDHRKEEQRLKELDTIVHDLLEKRKQNYCNNPLFDVWLGDFNALTRQDYTDAEWKSILQIREQTRWELPVSQLTSLMTTPNTDDAVVKKRTETKKKQNKKKSSKMTHTARFGIAGCLSIRTESTIQSMRSFGNLSV